MDLFSVVKRKKFSNRMHQTNFQILYAIAFFRFFPFAFISQTLYSLYCPPLNFLPSLLHKESCTQKCSWFICSPLSREGKQNKTRSLCVLDISAFHQRGLIHRLSQALPDPELCGEEVTLGCCTGSG